MENVKYTLKDASLVEVINSVVEIPTNNGPIITNSKDMIDISPYYDKESKSIMTPLLFNIHDPNSTKGPRIGVSIIKVAISKDVIMKCIQDEEE